MRARNLKPGFFKNPDLADAGPHAQLLFAGLWLLADKEGRLKDQPRFIKAEVFPYYDVDVHRELTVIERLGHIHRYVSSGIGVIEVCNFKKHQSPHHTEKASDLPACECPKPCISSVREIHGELTVNSPLRNGEYPSDSLIPDSLIQGKRPATPKRAKKPIKISLPDTLALTPDLLAYVSKTLPDADPAAMFDKFREQATAKGWQYADWAKAFQIYCRNSAKDSGHFAAGQYPKRAGAEPVTWR